MKLYKIDGSEIYLEGTKNSALTNKIWFPIGDSITNQGSYTHPISAFYDMTIKTGGFGDGYQCGYGSGNQYCILEKISSFPSEKPDIVTIALGTNDFGGGKTMLGTIDDKPDNVTSESYTFYGCYKKLIEELFEMYGRIPLLLITPFPRNGGMNANSNGHTLHDYVDAIKNIGEYYSIPVCDMYSYCGISIGTVDSITKMYTSDGLHLTNASGGIAGKKIADGMEYAISELVIECENLTAYAGNDYLNTPISISVGDIVKVYAVRNPTYTTYPMIWESSNENVASVVSSGNPASCSITGISNGTCTVTCTCGSATFDYEVTIGE